MSNPLPLGEEIWIRRDLESRGKPFIFRELHIICTLLVPAVPLIILAPIVFLLFQTGDLALQLAMAALTAAFLIAYCLCLFISRHIFRASRFIPIWLYAEQLNPETLTIHRLGKQPIQIQLAESAVQKQPFFKYYTIITITDKENNSATLPNLTHEEYDRFIAYWNAANPPIPVAQASRLCSSPLSPNG